MTERTQAIRLDELPRGEVPPDLRAETYFDFAAHPFAHRALFDRANSVCAAIRAIHDYATGWLQERFRQAPASARVADPSALPGMDGVDGAAALRVVLEEGAVFRPARVIPAAAPRPRTIYLARDARLIGADVYLDRGDIFLDEAAAVEPSAGLRGPLIVGRRAQVRQAAYLRGDCIIGEDAVVRGEIKNSVLMGRAEFPHHSYQGDSLCGYKSHFGAGATTANLGIFAGMREEQRQRSIVVACAGRLYDLGTRKMGICMGDYCQVGCNSVSDPATFLRPRTIVYALTRIPRGFYGPDEVLKNKPMERGVVERAPLRRED
ncbi:MAG: hypothetical protein FJ225_07070 [Lentisphaerae bacterium]|nr:hypothetical protein [Lentisphaerota bacterium]